MRLSISHVRLALGAICLGAAFIAGPAAAAVPYEVDLASQANVTINAAAGDRLSSVYNAGDVNGDAREDLVVGAQLSDFNGRANSGSTYVIFGQATPTNVDLTALGTRGYRIDGAAAGDRTGVVISGGADFNGDSRDDVLISSAFSSNNGRNASGSVHVIYGKASTSSVDLAALGAQGFRVDGVAANDNLGYGASPVGDLNGDGREELVVSGRGATTGGGTRAGAGAAYVIFGRAAPTSIDLASGLGTGGYRIEGAAAGDQFGYKANNAGDVNGDGKPDLIISAPYADNNGRAESGSSYVVFGKTSTTTVDTAALGAAGFRIDGAVAGDYSGWDAGAAGDANGDGLADLALGAPEAGNNGRATSGSGYVVFGKASTSTVNLASFGAQGYRIDGGAANDALGASVAPLGDVNDDGFDDMTVTGNHVTYSGRVDAGAAYVIYGRSSTVFPIDIASLGTQGYVIGGAAAGDTLGINGRSLASAGDFNGDGRPDLIVAAPFADAGGRVDGGGAYVVYSDPSPPVSAVSHTAGTRPDLQHWDSANRRLFYNPAATGSFIFANAATDAGSGVIAADFPAIAATGFNGAAVQDEAAPWASSTYTFGATNATAPADQTVTVQDGKGNRTSQTVSFRRDTSVESATISSPDEMSNATELTTSIGETGSGVASVEYRYCAGATCAWGASTAIGTSTTPAVYSQTWSSQPADGQYTVIARVTDRVGNTRDATKTVAVDNTAPGLTVAAGPVANAGRLAISGSTVFYNPTGATGSFDLLASPTDASGIAAVNFAGITGVSGFTGAARAPTSAPFSSNVYEFTASNAAAPAPISITATDTVGNTAGRTVTPIRDVSGPSLSIDPPGGSPISDGEVLSLTRSDSGAGAGTTPASFRYCPGTTCSWGSASAVSIGTAAAGTPNQLAWTSHPADGTYTVVARAADAVANTSDATRTFVLDNEGPGGGLSITSETGGQLQHYDSATGTLFYNPRAAGSFRIQASPSDPAGVASVGFPALAATGFSGSSSTPTAAPWRSGVYAFDATSSAAPADLIVSLTDGLGHSSSRSISFARDTTAPAGGSVSYPSGTVDSRTITVATAAGTDSGSGIAPGAGVIERQESLSTSGPCSGWGAWEPSSASDSTTIAGRCYRYRYTASDRVGNETTYDSSSTVRRVASGARVTEVAPAAPSGGASGDAGTPRSEDGPAERVSSNPLRIASRSVTLSPSGVAPIAVSCDNGGGVCEGDVVLFTTETTKGKARASISAAKKGRKRAKRVKKVVLGRAHYRLRPGAKAKIKVRISRRGRRRLIVKRRQRCRISISAGGRTVTRSITLKAPKRQQRAGKQRGGR